MTHAHHDVEVVDRGGGMAAGMMVAIATLVVLAIIALAVLWTQPWDDDNSAGSPSVPGVEDTVPDVVPGDGGDVAPGGGDTAPEPAQ